MKHAIINAIIYTGDSVLADSIVVVENGKIISVQKEMPKDANIIDLRGKNIAPGLIDIQLNGGYKYYFSQFPNENTLLDMCQACEGFGTSFFMPTLISSTLETILNSIEAVKKFMQKFPEKGVLGMHLEGPFFNKEKRGAHNEKIIRIPTDNELQTIVEHGKGIIKIMTIAPEVFTDGQIKYLQDNGVLLSAGHSNMSYEQAQYYFQKGIHLVTHLYNAMSSFTHRAPSLAAAALENENVYASIILDGFHCHYAAARLAYQLKKEKLFLITDSTFLGRKMTSFKWDAFDAVLQNNVYRNEEGNLAGAAISMPEAVKNAKENLSISLQQSIEMATGCVAKAIGMENEIGFIKANYPSKFFVFDNTLETYATIVL